MQAHRLLRVVLLIQVQALQQVKSPVLQSVPQLIQVIHSLVGPSLPVLVHSKVLLRPPATASSLQAIRRCLLLLPPKITPLHLIRTVAIRMVRYRQHIIQVLLHLLPVRPVLAILATDISQTHPQVLGSSMPMVH